MKGTRNPSKTTAPDGRPLCRTCGKPYTSLRIVINLASSRPRDLEDCQRCKQTARIAKLKAERGW